MIPTLLLLALAAANPAPRVLNRVAGTVNGEVVTLREVERQAGAALERAEALPAGPQRDAARASALRAAFDQLVAQRLFDAQAAQLGVEVGEAEVDAAVEEIKRRNRLDEAGLDGALAQQGMDRAAFRRSVRRDIESMRILQVKVRSRVNVSDEDVVAFYRSHPEEFRADEEVRVRHLFLALPPNASMEEEARVKARAARLLARARGGEDFGALARAESEGPSAQDGGDLGWLRRGTIQPELEKAAFGLTTGGVSDVIRTRAGLQILKVEERRGGGQRPFDEVKDEIRNHLVNEQLEKYRSQYVSELRRDAAVDVRMPELRDPASAPEPAPAASPGDRTSARP
jgi:peptidyl-prolyl cis-trans isomerase SurA